jgi:hypothetical protein
MSHKLAMISEAAREAIKHLARLEAMCEDEALWMQRDSTALHLQAHEFRAKVKALCSVEPIREGATPLQVWDARRAAK